MESGPNRYEFVTCVRSTRSFSLCGRQPGALEFIFVSKEHALANEASGGKLVLCKDCQAEIQKSSDLTSPNK